MQKTDCMDDWGGGIRNVVHRCPSEADIASKISGSMCDFEPGRLGEGGRQEDVGNNGGCTFPYVEKACCT
jgi:hypothetical protein